MNHDKSKAIWDLSLTGIFIEQCIEQILKKERQGSSFTKEGWKNILRAFNEKSGKSYDKKQLKNKLDSLKKEWKTWDKLFSKETGISFDSVRNVVIAENEWWDRKIKENADYAKYRFKGLMFAKELDILFKDVMASGEQMFAPSSTQRMSLAEDEDDVYRPTVDLQEGSGDSEEDGVGDIGGGSLGVTTDFEGVTLTTNTPRSVPSASGSIGKRKRAEGSENSRKKKIPTSMVIADAVSRIADATKDKSDALKKICSSDEQVTEVVAELLTIPEVANDKDFCRRCCNMMMYPIPRAMFLGMKGNMCALLEWLREHAYSSPHLQQAPKH